ncbi:hypothetical protein BDZ45DRAFT_788557 [Acephala macrosclerotiorum]|nr:hypothetical protein BDZ45DRAFT_788557 [Acephala macrosclerotiorum]
MPPSGSYTSQFSYNRRVIIGSALVPIFIGKDNQVFACHEDLLILHSGYFKERLRAIEADVDEKISLPEVNPEIFAEFYAWMYTGKWLGTSCLCKSSTEKEVYALATLLEAPAFQNFCMDAIMKTYQIEEYNWLYISSVESVYNVTKKDSLHRKLTSRIVNCKNPLQVFPKGSGEWKLWRDWKGPKGIFQKHPDLEEDLATLDGKDWKGTFPWDECYRKDYMVEVIPLDVAWENQLLVTQSLEDRKKDARNKNKPQDVRSKIELDHLQREKEPAARDREIRGKENHDDIFYVGTGSEVASAKRFHGVSLEVTVQLSPACTGYQFKSTAMSQGNISHCINQKELWRV